MCLFNSLLPSLKLWRLVGLSPFAVEPFSTSNINRHQDLIQIIRIFIVVLLSIFIIVIHTIYVLDLDDAWLQFWGVFAYSLALLAQLIILIESFIKRESQMKFLIQQNAIDSFMVDQIGIVIDYGLEQKQHTKRLRRWNILYGIAFVTSFSVVLASNSFYLMSVSLFTYIAQYTNALCFHQFTTYVHLIKYRYVLINEFINKIYLSDLNRFMGHTQKIEEHRKPVNKIKLIGQLRHVSNLLVESSQQLNDLFSASLKVCILKYFCCSIGNNYTSLEIAVKNESWVVFSIAIFSLLPVGNDFISAVNACEDTTEEVSKSCILFMQTSAWGACTTKYTNRNKNDRK